MSGCRLATLLHVVLVCVCLSPFLAFDSVAQTPGSGQVQAPFWSSKPDLSAFDRIENEWLAAVQKFEDQIVAVKGQRTVENTLVPYDETLRQLGMAFGWANLMQQVHPDAGFRDSATAMTTKVSAVWTALSLNQPIFDALKGIELKKADDVTRYYVERQLLEYRLAGVDKVEATRARLKKLQDRLVELQSKFDRNISDDTRGVTVESAAELEGLPQHYLDAHKPGAEGKIRITTAYPDYLPVMKFAKNDDLRRKLLVTFNNRAFPKNPEQQSCS